MVNRAALIDQIQQARETPEKLLTLTSIGTRRARPICLSPLSGAKGIPASTAKLPESPASKSSGVSSRRSRLPKDWIAGAILANGRNCSCWRKGAPTAQPTAKNFALKDPLKSDVCLMASEKSCDCRIRGSYENSSSSPDACSDSDHQHRKSENLHRSKL